MTQKEIIAGRLTYVRSWLNDVLPRISPEVLDWAPAQGVRTIAGQLVEIISVEAQLVPVLRGEGWLAASEMAQLASEESSLSDLLQALNDVREQTLQALNALTEEELEAEVSLPQWYGAYWPASCPRGEHFRNIAEHEFYHVGQLNSYFWMRGDNPYDW